MTREVNFSGITIKHRYPAVQRKRLNAKSNALALTVISVFSFGLISLHAAAFAEGQDKATRTCQILSTNKQCVNLAGTWKVKASNSYSRVLEIKSTDKPWMFDFMVEAVRGGSITHIESQFQVKSNIGVYVALSEDKDEKPCAIAFIPTEMDKLTVTSFGSCSQGHATSPDGIYIKTK